MHSSLDVSKCIAPVFASGVVYLELLATFVNDRKKKKHKKLQYNCDLKRQSFTCFSVVCNITGPTKVSPQIHNTRILEKQTTTKILHSVNLSTVHGKQSSFRPPSLSLEGEVKSSTHTNPKKNQTKHFTHVTYRTINANNASPYV